MENIINIKDCISDEEIILALENETLELDDMEDWNKLKGLAENLSKSQGFYDRLLKDMNQKEADGLKFPFYV